MPKSEDVRPTSPVLGVGPFYLPSFVDSFSPQKFRRMSCAVCNAQADRPFWLPMASRASHALSTGTAVNVLRNGGNAMDAAIAACAVQGC